MQLRGAFRILLLYDVAEALDLDRLRGLLGAKAATAPPDFPRRTPQHVRFERPPLVEAAESLRLEPGEALASTLKYYSFGVVVAELEAPFACRWDELVALAPRWLDAGVEPHARELVRRHLAALEPAVVAPTTDWLHERYLTVQINEIADPTGDNPDAALLLARHGGSIAQLVRGEVVPLAPRAADETLQAALSYYPADLFVPGSFAALVYDRADDAAAIQQVLEYAKMQLLEFRYYDGLMSRLLAEVHARLVQPRNLVLQRWRLPREATRFNSIRLDVMDLTERVDSAIKFVSDAYYARVYRQAAARMGVPEYRNLVDQKLRAAGELYEFMMDEFNEARSFVLEAGVAFLCLLDLLFWLKFH